MPGTSDAAKVEALAGQWPDETRDAWLDYLSTASKREIIKDSYSDAADLARALDPNYRITPAIALIARNIETALTEPHHNLLVSTPPQEGKTSLCAVYAPLRALQLNHSARIILASYSSELAQDASRRCRELINTHGSGITDPLTGKVMDDKLGYQLAPGSNKMSSWKLRGARGGMVAVGLGASITGRSADTLLIDDPIKNPMEADSANHRRKVANWFSQVARTRLSPRASMVLVMTRWHPDDLAGRILADELGRDLRFRTWKHINIPAISEEGIRDDLHREPGVAMVSARGRTKQEFEQTRREVGDRTWFSMYQGVPSNPEGGLFARAWFDPPADAPADAVATVVGVDPADSGHDDDTGIIAAALTGTGTVVFTDDWSGKFTSDQWSRRAVLLALTVGAREIGLEAYSAAATYENALKAAYRAIHTDALTKRRTGADLTLIESRALSETPPFLIYKWRAGARIDAVGRSALLRQALETRRARVVEHKMANLIEDACLPATAMITTPTGARPILEIRTGDMVVTRAGPRVVTWSGQTGVRDLLRITTDGPSVELTGNHKVWTARGWIDAGHLLKGDTLIGWHPSELDHHESSEAAYIPAPIRDITLTRRVKRKASAVDYCTVMCGLAFMARFLRASRFTTATTTKRTITQTTLKPYRKVITRASTRLMVAGLPGTLRRVAASVAQRGSVSSPSNAHALTAGVATNRPECGPSTAPPNAAATITANGAASWLDGDTTQQGVVRNTIVLSVEPVRRTPEPVYDITVADRHEFFADGILVHNCDWQVGQHCPDRVAAAVIAHDRLAVLGSGRMTVAAPVDRPNEQVVPFRRPGTGGEGFRRRLRRP